MLNPDICCLENSVDSDQLASEKPTDQNPHCFYSVSAYKYMLITEIVHAYWVKIGSMHVEFCFCLL